MPPTDVDLAEPMRGALQLLLRGFEEAAKRNQRDLLDSELARDADHLFKGLQTVLLRLAFLQCAKDLGLPSSEPSGGGNAWQRLTGCFRKVFDRVDGAVASDSPRRDGLFDPEVFPFLEIAACAPDDVVVSQLLERLAVLDEQSEQRAVDRLGRVYEALMGYRIIAAADGYVLQAVGERRKMGSHYTPASLCAAIVARALEPLLADAGGGAASPSARILALRVCDPAMGSGAFLVEACRYLADQLVAAWKQEAMYSSVASEHGDPIRHARRLVTKQCLYGVDKDGLAVQLARLSLWLFIDAADETFGFVDTNLRHGDALVGLSLDQIHRFHWSAGAAADPIDGDSLTSDRAQLIGDVLIGAFFAHDKKKDREAERQRRFMLVQRLRANDDSEVAAELRRLQLEARAQIPALHWPLAFPQLGPDKGGGFDALIGNPPFLGGKRISTEHGDRFAHWLQMLHSASKNVDLAAHFFRRADSLLGPRGTIGFIATNTLAEGDTRRDGLRYLVAQAGHIIYDAVPSRPWPGQAAVHIAIVHLAKGLSKPPLLRLDGNRVEVINSMLRAMPERPDALALASSRQRCFIGCFLRGRGFVFSRQEGEALRKEKAHRVHVRPFLGGEEVNSSPNQDFDRYAIDFGNLELDQAQRWPQLLALLEERVRPGREILKDHGVDLGHKRRWWQFANPRPELRAALVGLSRCLVAPRVSKHLSFAFQPTDRVFSDQLCVFALDDICSFAILQSRVHECWARLQSSTMGLGLRYAPSDCVETFAPPLPWGDVDEGLQQVGSRLHESRATFLVRSEQGLTRATNQLKDPKCQTRSVVALRRLHEQLDRAVLDAYGWTDIEVPPFCSATPDDDRAWTRFRDEVINRLFDLNATRAAEEHRHHVEAANAEQVSFDF